MNLKVYIKPNVSHEVEAEATENPELAIFTLKVMDLPETPGGTIGAAPKESEIPVKGKVWAIAHIPSGTVVMYGLLTRDLAVETVRMITASGFEFGAGKRFPFALDAFQAAARTMTDWYFQILYSTAENEKLAQA